MQHSWPLSNNSQSYAWAIEKGKVTVTNQQFKKWYQALDLDESSNSYLELTNVALFEKSFAISQQFIKNSK